LTPPGRAVIGGLPGMHLITKGGRMARLATGRYSWCLVIPRGEESTSFAGREVGLPLRLGGVGVGVQLERGAEGHAAVGGADVKDVAGVTVTGVAGGIDEGNDMVKGGRLAPALVSPVSGVGVHGGKEAGCAAPWARELRSGVGVGPGNAAIGGAVHLVGPIGEPPIELVHAGDVHVARDLVAGDLHVADEVSASGNLNRTGPPHAVVSGANDEDAAAGAAWDIKVVPGNIHSPEEGRGCVVIRKARLSVGRGLAENTEVGPAIRIPGSGGLVAPEALTAAACVQPHGQPSLAWLVVQNNRIALRTSKWALTIRPGEAIKSGATVGGNRGTRDIDRAGIAAS